MSSLATHWQGAATFVAVALAAAYLLLRARQAVKRTNKAPECANCPAAKGKND